MEDNFINIEKLVQLFKKKIWIILLITAITTSIGVYKASQMKPSYKSTVGIFFGLNQATLDYQSVQQVNFYKNNMKLFKEMVITDDFYKSVVKKHNLDKTASQIAASITFTYSEESPVCYMNYSSSKNEGIEEVLDSVAEEFIISLKEIVIDSKPTVINTSKVSTIIPNKKRVIGLYVIVGLVISIGAVLLIDYLDDRIKDRDELEKVIPIPVLGDIPSHEKKFEKGDKHVCSKRNAKIGISRGV